jgi:hypothetical protein
MTREQSAHKRKCSLALTLFRRVFAIPADAIKSQNATGAETSQATGDPEMQTRRDLIKAGVAALPALAILSPAQASSTEQLLDRIRGQLGEIQGLKESAPDWLRAIFTLRAGGYSWHEASHHIIHEEALAELIARSLILRSA